MNESLVGLEGRQDKPPRLASVTRSLMHALQVPRLLAQRAARQLSLGSFLQFDLEGFLVQVWHWLSRAGIIGWGGVQPATPFTACAHFHTHPLP